MELDWIEHKGRKIKLVDYRNLNEDQMIEKFRSTMKEYQSISEPIYSLLDYSDSFVSSRYFNALLTEGAAETRRDKIVKSAIIGLNLAKLAYLDIYKTLTQDNRIRVFEKKEDALDWLAEP
ncbi:hypothetical protein [Leptospira idonii]|uniref:STAS/SEC14 domain-containing protein n=1 Tax=Leptospira idonii TaxID=1193500 RepID=A0A4V3JY20_9LEPT|nr:hypothetical protein [Leptospira idonii]TGN19266.1 hypothetical protein EHS15_10150 [Leptospira idonii]